MGCVTDRELRVRWQGWGEVWRAAGAPPRLDAGGLTGLLLVARTHPCLFFGKDLLHLLRTSLQVAHVRVRSLKLFLRLR